MPGILAGLGEGAEALHTNYLQDQQNDRANQELALKTPGLQGQGQQQQALGEEAQMGLEDAKKKKKMREETVPAEDIMKSNPMMPYLAKYVDQSGINMSKTMPKKGDIQDYGQWLHTEQGLPFFQKGVEEFRNDNLQKSAHIDEAIKEQEENIKEFQKKNPTFNPKNDNLDDHPAYKKMVDRIQELQKEKQPIIGNRKMAELAQAQIDKQVELKNKGPKQSPEDQWLTLDQKERLGQQLTPAEQARKASINAYLDKTKVELPGAAQTAKDRADEAEYRKNLGGAMKLLSQGRIMAGTSNFKPLLSAVYFDEINKWNEKHPDEQINPNLIKAVQDGNKAAMQRMTTLAAAASTGASTVEKQIKQQLRPIVDGLTSTDITWLNHKLRQIEAGTGSVNAAAFFNILNEVVPEYAKVMQGTNASSVSATDASQELAKKLLPEGATIPQLKKNMALMEQSMGFRLGSNNETIQSLQSAIGGGTVYQSPGGTPAPANASDMDNFWKK